MLNFLRTNIQARLLVLAVILLSVTWLTNAKAESYSWRNVKIGGGGYVTGIEFHPQQKGLVYARTDVGGAYRRDSPDGPWIALNDSIGGFDNAFMQLGVLSLALDPDDADRVYLACGQYTTWWAPPAVLMASSDRGATWTTTELPFRLGGNQDGRGTDERLAVDPSNGSRLLLGTTQDGLWLSTERGSNWTRATGFPADSTTFVRFDPARPGTVFAGVALTTEPSVWKSTDGGETWAAVPGQPEALIALQTALDAEGNLYVTYADAIGPNGVSKGSLWKLSPNGTWENLKVPGEGGGFGGVATDLSVPGRILVSTLNRWWPCDEVYRSDDGGKTWSGILAESQLDHTSAPWAASLKPHWITDIEIDPFTPGRATFVTGYGLFTTSESVVAGEDPAWVFDNKGIEECVPLGLVSPASGPALVSVIFDFDGFRHDDLNRSPSGGRHAPFHGSSSSLDGAGAAPEVLARLHGETGSISRDGGSTWKDFPSAPPSAGGGQIGVSADGARLLWCPKDGTPHFSEDDGVNWTPSTGCPSGKFWPAADRVNRLQFSIYDSTARKVHRSNDGGVSFLTMEALLPEGGHEVETVPGHAGHLWHPAGKGGLWLSTDGGAKFHQADTVEAAYRVGFGKPASRGSYPAVFMWGRVSGAEGIFRSDDKGRQWCRINDDRHRFGAINDLTGDPRVFGRVYLGTSGRGVIVGEPDQEPDSR